MRYLLLVLSILLISTFAWTANLTVTSGSGRSVMRRGEPFDVAVRAMGPATTQAAILEFWLDMNGFATRLAVENLAPLKTGQWDGYYRIDTRNLAVGKGQLRIRILAGDQTYEAKCPLEIASNVATTDFRIHNIGIPGWILPTGNWPADLQGYHFNMALTGADNFMRASSPGPSNYDLQMEDMLRNNMSFYKYPTVFGWGLAHRPIGMHYNGSNEVSWFDPAGIEISKQLVQYHTQACRRFPNFEGLNPMDEPDVWGADAQMVEAFEKQTGLKGPLPEERPDPRWQYLDAFYKRDPKTAAAFEIFRNTVLQQFNAQMKPYMLEVAPQVKYTLQTMYDTHTAAGLYPSENVFQDVQSTHVYVDGPVHSNWMLFDANLRHANRDIFWKMPLYVVTGCYGIPEDQWRSSWALGMSQKLDGHGYFLGAGELGENLPWAEFSLAEMTRINKLDEQYGNFFLALQKPVEPLAVWFSLAQIAAADHNRHCELEEVGAFYATRRAHFPSTVVVDEDLRAGKLKEHKVLLLADISADDLPADLRRAVEDFQARGGVLVADRLSRGWKNTVPMDTDFSEFAKALYLAGGGENGLRMKRPTLSEQSIIRDLGKVEQALAPYVARPVDARSPYTLLATQTSGTAKYVFVANDASVDLHPNEGERWVTLRESVPAFDSIKLPVNKTDVVYDLWSGKKLDVVDGQVALDMPLAGLNVLCIFPKAVPDGTLSVKATGWPGGIDVSVSAGRGAIGVIPGAIEIADANGRPVFKKFVAIDLSKPNAWHYEVAVDDPAGKWQVSYTNLLTKKAATSIVDVGAAKSGNTAVVSCLPQVRLFDGQNYPAFAKRTGIIVAPGKGCEEIAGTLAKALNAEVKTPEEITKDDVIPEVLQTVKGRWMMGRPKPLSLTVGADLVLVGTPENNSLLKELNASGMLPWQMAATTLGKGQGLVEYVWSPFDLDKDAVTICGYDDAGLRAAADRFLAATRAVVPEAATALPAGIAQQALPPPAAPPATAQPAIAPATIVMRTGVRDGIRKMAWTRDLLAVGGQDCRLTVFNSDGKELWHRDYPYRVTGVAISEDGSYVTAHAFPRSYVYDRNGNLLYELASPTPSREDVEGMLLLTDAQGEQLAPQLASPPDDKGNQKPGLKPRLLTANWLGDVKCFDINGKSVWQFATAPVKDAKPEDKRPEPIGAGRAIAHLPDGSYAIAGQTALVVLDIKGQEVVRKKIDRMHTIAAAGDNIFAGSIKRNVALLDKQLNVIWTKKTPHIVMSVAASQDGNTLVAALFHGDLLVYNTDGTLVKLVRIPGDIICTSVAVDAAGQYAWCGTWEGELLKVRLQ